ncbi:iron ABC transporter ATP-binding protein [Compostimonas suwonensis]|uniref:Iron ABC transporter ATP-binding protein n=1 Tax=Compostimonas suwonensis TaxID=1048394 RepID=A0A2M9BUH9_9MICO|nr:iron ABC transporter ATP-binding protein [Compostimonas suwonensis]PJJ61608.1 hypothetical protein CLV54_2554 [Compostimonas suwonensis]
MRAGLVAFTTVAVLATLAACTSDPVSTVKPTKVASETPAADPSETPTTTPTPTEDPGIPVTIACDQLLTPDDVYAFNPNFGTQPDYAPAEGSSAAEIVAAQGLSCGWLNQTSGDTISASVGQFGDPHLESLKNTMVMESKPVPTYGDPATIEGYFEVENGVGQANVFSGPYWISMSSTFFVEPGDAQPLVAAALANLGQ